MSLAWDDPAPPARTPREAATIEIGGLAFVADAAGALVLPEDRLLLVADLQPREGLGLRPARHLPAAL